MPLKTFFEYAGYLVVFLTMISVLVAAHELGHYLFARWFGMGVEEFSIGFGPRPLVVWMRRTYVVPVEAGQVFPPTPDEEQIQGASSSNIAVALASKLEGTPGMGGAETLETPSGLALRETTEFTVRPLPLGGFVRIKGMVPEEDGSETRIPGGFYSKSPWKRFIVLLAGPMFSILAGVFVLVPSLMVDGKQVPQNVPILDAVLPQSPASQAGLQKGDRIVAIDGRPVTTFYQIIQALQDSGGRPLQFRAVRQGHEITTSVTPALDANGPSPVRGPDMQFTDRKAVQYKMGALCQNKKVPLSLVAAMGEAVDIPIEAANRLFGLVRKPSDFSDMVAGPATMVSATADAVQLGIWSVVELTGLLSISVGILNLLPAPPLDGGQMAMAVAEMFRRGRRLSLRAQAIASGIGLGFVALLIFGALAVDFKRFTTPEKPLIRSAHSPK